MPEAMLEVLKDKEVLAITKETSSIVIRTQNFQIVSEETASDANMVLHWIAQKKKELEKRRQFLVKPLNDHIKVLNAEFKIITGPLGEADGVIRGKVVDYRIKIRQEAEKREEELQREAEKKRQEEVKEAESKGEAPPPPAPKPTVEVSKTTEGITMVKTWTYEEQNVGQVPREYLVLDSGAVMRAIRQGVREIPGIRIYQKETVKVGG